MEHTEGGSWWDSSEASSKPDGPTAAAAAPSPANAATGATPSSSPPPTPPGTGREAGPHPARPHQNPSSPSGDLTIVLSRRWDDCPPAIEVDTLVYPPHLEHAVRAWRTRALDITSETRTVLAILAPIAGDNPILTGLVTRLERALERAGAVQA